MRPGSIEFQWNSKLLKHKVRSSMGDCHSFDPGSNPGPGASFLFILFKLEILCKQVEDLDVRDSNKRKSIAKS
jgi:hypothetical protein